MHSDSKTRVPSPHYTGTIRETRVPSYAIIEIDKWQYKVEPGSKISIVGKIDTKKRKILKFDKVLFASKDDEILVGNPYIKNATCTGEVLDQKKGKKIVVFKYKRKKRYRKKTGHRSLITDILIKEIKCP